MENKKKQKIKKQPMPKSGYSFNGWAVFNWGMSRDTVFRTRKEAQDFCWQGNITFKNGVKKDSECWNDVKDHMAVVKVKVTVV